MNSLTGVHEFFQQLKAIAYGIWRKRWAMLISAWIVAASVWTIVLFMPHRYEAHAQVFVDAQTALPAIARNLGIDVDVLRQVDLVRRTLVTRPNLERIVRRSDHLEHFAQDQRGMDEWVSYLQRNIRVRSIDTNMFRIEFDIDDARLTERQRAEVARTVVNGLLSFFLERSSAKEGDAAQGADLFLDQQIMDYAERLEKADRQRALFRQDNLLYLGGQNNYLSRLREEQNRLRGTEQDIVELKVSLAELEHQLEAIPPTVKIAARSGAVGSAPKDPLDERIAELQKKLDELRSFGYKDRHPDVASTIAQIDDIKREKEVQENQIQEELARAAAAGEKASRSDETANPLYEQVYLQLIEGRQNQAKLERRAHEQGLLVSEMETRAKKVPEIEAEEKRLSRDYETIQKQYNDLLGQRENYALKKSVEGLDDSLALRVVEPPVVPQNPSGPPRRLYMAFGLFASLAVGFGVAFLLSQLRPVVLSVEQLRSHFDLVVLGGVTRILSEAENRRQSYEMLLFFGAFAGLFIGFGLLTAIDLLGG